MRIPPIAPVPAALLSLVLILQAAPAADQAPASVDAVPGPAVDEVLGSRTEIEGNDRGRRRGGRGWRGRGRFRRNRVSTRRDGFALAVLHDGALQPKDCGGPILDVHGNCVGLNIARASRYGTLAIPSSVILELLADIGKSASAAPKKPAKSSGGK